MEPEGNAHREAGRLDAVFAALADPTRRAILSRLIAGEASVSELAEPFRLSQPAISKHLRVLERAGLISGREDAQRRPRRLEPVVLGEAELWFGPFRRLWEARYAELDRVLDDLKVPARKPRRPARAASATAKRRKESR